MKFVTTSVGLETPFCNANTRPSILLPCKQIHPYLSQISSISLKQLLSAIPSIWDSSCSSFYRLMRRCVQIQSSVHECHPDLSCDYSHSTWTGLTGRLFELSQMQAERLWNFSIDFSIMMDLMAVLSSPANRVDSEKLRAFLVSVEDCHSVACQCLSILGTSCEQGVVIAAEMEVSGEPAPATQQQPFFALLQAVVLNLRSLQRTLMNAPEIRTLLFGKQSSVTRLTVQLQTAIMDAVGWPAGSRTEGRSSVDCLESQWKPMLSLLMSQHGIPYSVRLNLHAALTNLLTATHEITLTHEAPIPPMESLSSDAVEGVSGCESLLCCLKSLQANLDVSTDWVRS